MAVFRIEKTRDYTVMSNHHLRNTDLSLKAKGLLSLMLSLPEDWDYTMKGLARICKDGIDSISGGIRELEAHGYLIRERIRNENGQLGSIEYTILEQPKPPAPMQEPPILENPIQAVPTLDTPMQGDPAQLNTKVSSNQVSKKDLSITEPSNPIRSNPPTPAGARMGTDGMGAREAYREVILENIGYEYSQLFNLLCDKADDFYGGRLPVHVRLILDEFANVGQIPNFDKLIATIRSREISASIILQSQSQLKAIYKDNADTIVGNCDSTLFLGGKEKSTLKEISELLGKETIDSYNQSENRGSQISHGLSYQKLGKELMTQDELAVMDGGKCIFMLRGVRPFLSDKYDLTRHPNYKYTADADPKNVFDMERYMKKQRAVVKPGDRFDVYEIDVNE